MFAKAKINLLSVSQKVGASLRAPSSAQIQVALFVFGVGLLSVGLLSGANADYTGVGKYNDDRFAESVDLIMTYLQGAFGALVMVAAGIGAILSSAFGQYRAALGLLVVAVGSFILRSIISTFFNDSTMQVNTISE